MMSKSRTLEKEIKEESKRLMEKFSDILKESGIDVIKKEEVADCFNKEDKLRNDNKPVNCPAEFRTLMFSIAPKKEGDFIKAEKGKWIQR